MKELLRTIRQSLVLKLSIGTLLFAIPFFFLSMGLLFLQSRFIIKKEAVERATSQLNNAAERIAIYLSTVKIGADANLWLVHENMQPDSLLAITRRIVMLNGHLNSCSVTTEPDYLPQLGRYFSAYSLRKGDSIYTVREAPFEYFDEPWYKTPAKRGEPCWVEPYFDANKGTFASETHIISYCRPLYDADRRFIGVLSTDLSLASLADAVSGEKPYPNAYFTMLGAEGRYFIHPDTAKNVRQTIFDDKNPRHDSDLIALGHEMTTGKSGAMRVHVGGKPCLACYRPVSGTPWSLALIVPDSDILKRYYRLSYILLPLLLIGMLLILWLCRRIISSALHPLEELTYFTQHIAAGKYDEQLPRSGRLDAVGQLEDSVASMQQSLQRHIGDITRLNQEMEERNRELHQASLLAEEAARQKAAFIDNMSHQIRTPLNIILGFAQVLRDNHSELPPEEVGTITEMMEHNAHHLDRMQLMLYDTADIGRVKESQRTYDDVVSCNEVARECIGFTEHQFPGTKVTLDTQLPDDCCLRTNHLYLMRSLRELLYNAAKYSDGQHIAIRLRKTPATVQFVIEDTGPGIPADYMDLLFVPFTKVNYLSEGLGLGLPLTMRHAKSLGGSLTLDPQYKQGCRFVLELNI